METRAKDAKGTSSETEEEGMVDLRSIARGLLSKARQAEKKITPELIKSAEEARGRLVDDDCTAAVLVKADARPGHRLGGEGSRQDRWAQPGAV